MVLKCPFILYIEFRKRKFQSSGIGCQLTDKEKETQFVDVTAVLLITFTNISLGLKPYLSLTQHCLLPVFWENFRAKLCYAALGWALKSNTVCRQSKANWSAGIQSLGVNTVQHASAINITARALFGCSHILKTMVPRLAATERKRAIGGLTARHPPNMAATAVGGHPSAISLASFPDNGNHPARPWETHRL